MAKLAERDPPQPRVLGDAFVEGTEPIGMDGPAQLVRHEPLAVVPGFAGTEPLLELAGSPFLECLDCSGVQVDRALRGRRFWRLDMSPAIGDNGGPAHRHGSGVQIDIGPPEPAYLGPSETGHRCQPPDAGQSRLRGGCDELR